MWQQTNEGNACFWTYMFVFTLEFFSLDETHRLSITDSSETWFFLHFQNSSELIDSDFIPQVSATCKQEHMSIRVIFNGSFNGAVHARDFRTPACMSHGDGGKLVTLDINLSAQQESPDYCGLLVNNVSRKFYLYGLIFTIFPSFKYY